MSCGPKAETGKRTTVGAHNLADTIKSPLLRSTVRARMAVVAAHIIVEAPVEATEATMMKPLLGPSLLESPL